MNRDNVQALCVILAQARLEASREQPSADATEWEMAVALDKSGVTAQAPDAARTQVIRAGFSVMLLLQATLVLAMLVVLGGLIAWTVRH